MTSSSLRPTPRATELADICALLGIEPIVGVVSGVTLDSRSVAPGDLYAALPGAITHGARFAAQAVAAGATAVLTDPAGTTLLDADLQAPVLVVPEPRAVLGVIAARVYDGARPLLVGITGTNGKTTTTHCVRAIAAAAGTPCALIGTLGVAFGDLHAYSGRTTPEAPEVHATLAALAEAGASVVAMEVSSHALALHRVDAVVYDVAVFLNLTQDHLDYHGTMDAYFAAKAQLFTPAHARSAVINIDDPWGRTLAANIAIPFVTFGAEGADWTATDVRRGDAGRTRFTAHGPDIDVEVTLSMPGDFNVSNALAALAAAGQVGIDLAVGVHGLATVSVPGRLEYIDNTRGIAAYADYAHTPDAVDRVLRVARTASTGRVIAVLGCGGDRDPLKRPLMGEAASRLADVVIVTDDNPRSECAEDIRSAVIAGATGPAELHEVGDRAEAIAQAVALATAGDCVIVLGKGHETGQEIAGVMHPFDDREELRRAMR